MPLSHAYGAAFDNPDLIVACVVGDGEAETGPLATSWHSNKFLNPVTDGAVLPILHLNGYKIANPTVLARISHEELDHLFRGYGYTPYFVEGNEPDDDARTHGGHAGYACAMKSSASRPTRAQNGFTERPRWPMIVLRTPKGWTCPKEIDGKRTEDYWRVASGADGRDAREPGARADSRRVDEELSASGTVRRRTAACGRNWPSSRPAATPPHERQSARQWRLAAARPAAARFPRLCGRCAGPGRGDRRIHPGDGPVPARCHEAEHGGTELPPVQPRREQFQSLAGRSRGHQPRLGRGNSAVGRPSCR